MSRKIWEKIGEFGEINQKILKLLRKTGKIILENFENQVISKKLFLKNLRNILECSKILPKFLRIILKILKKILKIS